VTNFGPSTATALSVTDSLPAGLIFVSAIPTTTTNAANQVIWSALGDLAAGGSTNLTLIVTTAAQGIVTNFASVGSSTLDTTDTNNVSTPVITAVTNRPPVAVNDTASTSANSAVTVPVLANDSDPDGQALTIVSVSATNGSANIVGTNVVFNPATNFIGTATVGYTVSDGNGGTNSALVTISVTDHPPVANNDSYVTAQNVALVVPASGGVLTNDTDADNNALTAVLASNPAHGTLVLSTNGGFTYTPTNNFTGTDTFTYRASDGLTNSGLATVTLTVLPVADLVVTKTGPTNGVAGSNLVYTITVTNLGPSTATNVAVQDWLPVGFTFVSAVPATATVSNQVVSWPGFRLANGARSNFTVTVVSVGGNFTNVAAATSALLDPNPTNNNGSAATAQVKTLVAPGGLPISVGTNSVPLGGNQYRVSTNAFNPQSGLFEELVVVTNNNLMPIAGVRLYVGGLRTGVTLNNASGTTNGVPFVQYNSPVNAGGTMTFALEFYDANRLAFTNTLTAVALLVADPAAAGGTNGVAITKVFTDTRLAGDTRFVIEFTSTPGRTYTVLYSDDAMATWQVASPSVTANATVTQWYDDGPPKTASKPESVGSRLYRVWSN
jgi:uncharacterized repeat protein (TIGR01451 family)